MAQITAALGHDRYNWHTFQGKRAVTLHYKGQPHTKLQAGMRYGMRHSNDGKSIHLITEHNGKNIVHKISHDHSERLAERSKPLRAGTKIKDPHSHTETKPKKPASKERPAPVPALVGKPKKRGRNRTSVHEAIEDAHKISEKKARKHARNLHSALGLAGYPVEHHVGMAGGGHGFESEVHREAIHNHLTSKGWKHDSTTKGKKSVISRYTHSGTLHMAELRSAKSDPQHNRLTIY